MAAGQAGEAADIHRVAGALIPGYDTSLHSRAEYLAFYRDEVIPKDAVWGAFHGDTLVGFIALLPGWIDHLYVHPDFHRRGIGTRLLTFAQKEQDELRLYTFQSNANARAFYERHGFVIEEMTDGERNEEKMPDMTYHWRADHPSRASAFSR
ncbi:MAG: GNAT family N-acetyltransferase [Sphingomonas bacterium]